MVKGVGGKLHSPTIDHSHDFSLPFRTLPLQPSWQRPPPSQVSSIHHSDAERYGNSHISCKNREERAARNSIQPQDCAETRWQGCAGEKEFVFSVESRKD